MHNRIMVGNKQEYLSLSTADALSRAIRIIFLHCKVAAIGVSTFIIVFLVKF